MRLLADEHVPPAFVSALRGEGHDVEVVGDVVDLGSEDTDFRGAEPAVSNHPGVLACDTGATPGEIAAATRRIDAVTENLTGTVLFVPGNWL